MPRRSHAAPADPRPAHSPHTAQETYLPRLRHQGRPPIGLRGVSALRVVAVRVNAGQLDWLPDDPPSHRSALPILDERLRGTKFVALANRSILNAPQQTGMDFWSLNPYVGCEFGCSYCYARYTHRYAVERAHDAGKLSDAEFADFRGAHGWEAFERRVFVKEQALAALERDLPRVKPGETIVIGTATDPYQPAERRFKITRGVLERLARCDGLS